MAEHLDFDFSVESWFASRNIKNLLVLIVICTSEKTRQHYYSQSSKRKICHASVGRGQFPVLVASSRFEARLRLFVIFTMPDIHKQ